MGNVKTFCNLSLLGETCWIVKHHLPILLPVRECNSKLMIFKFRCVKLTTGPNILWQLWISSSSILTAMIKDRPSWSTAFRTWHDKYLFQYMYYNQKNEKYIRRLQIYCRILIRKNNYFMYIISDVNSIWPLAELKQPFHIYCGHTRQVTDDYLLVNGHVIQEFVGQCVASQDFFPESLCFHAIRALQGH